jgi:hypothetical protein
MFVRIIDMHDPRTLRGDGEEVLSPKTGGSFKHALLSYDVEPFNVHNSYERLFKVRDACYV